MGGIGQRLVIEILKNGDAIGNIYFHWDGYFLNAIDRVRAIIDNYNKNLTSKDLSDEILAIRLFDLDKSYGTSDTDLCKPAYMEASLEFAKQTAKTFGTYFDSEFGRGEECGIVALTKDDMISNIHGAEYFAVIDLDCNIVSFENLWEEYDFSEYEEIYEDNNPYDLNYCPVPNFSEVSFNELEELYNFIKSNIEGFLNEYNDDVVYIPVE